MRNYGQIFIGIAIIVVGLSFLAGSIFNVDMGRFLCPAVLILAGVWLLVRPRLVSPGTALTTKLLGDVRRRGEWQVTDEEIWIGVGDVRLDMTNADIPTGETHIRTFGFVGDVVLTVPEGVGVAASSTSFATEARIFGQKYNRVFTPFHFTSEGYETAGRKVHLDASYFVADIKVRRATTTETA